MPSDFVAEKKPWRWLWMASLLHFQLTNLNQLTNPTDKSAVMAGAESERLHLLRLCTCGSEARGGFEAIDVQILGL